MFPFVNNLRNASARNAYTRSEVQEINRLAAKSNLEVIPLVQTFGHLEFVLKLEEFRHYREMMDFPQEVCPNHPDVMTLIKDLLMQVYRKKNFASITHFPKDLFCSSSFVSLCPMEYIFELSILLACFIGACIAPRVTLHAHWMRRSLPPSSVRSLLRQAAKSPGAAKG